MTLFSCFGSPTSTVNAVDFLGSWLQLPGHPMDLYVETMMITRYGQVALSVMGFAFLTILMTFNYYGKIKIRLGRLVSCVALLVAVTAAVAWGGHVLLSDVLKRPQKTYLGFSLPSELTQGVKAKFYQSRDDYLRDNPDAGLKPGETVLARIQRTQTLRVGYGRDIVPFAYRNQKGDLVGYDVACAYDMAKSLNVSLVFVPVVYEKVEQDVCQGIMDIWAGGVYVVESRMLWGTFSDSYYHSPMALIVPSTRVASFMSMEAINGQRDLAIAVFDNPVMRNLGTSLFPQAKQIVVPDYGQLPTAKGWSAALWTLEQAGVWASGHPGYTAVRPKHMGAVMVFAYLMHKNSGQLRQFVNHWLDMRQADGFLATQRSYWIEGSVAGGVRDR